MGIYDTYLEDHVMQSKASAAENLSVESSDGRPATARLRAFFARRPVISALIIFLIEMVMIIPLHLIIKALARMQKNISRLALSA